MARLLETLVQAVMVAVLLAAYVAIVLYAVAACDREFARHLAPYGRRVTPLTRRLASFGRRLTPIGRRLLRRA